MSPLSAIWARKGVAAAELGGFALLALVFYGWLGIPDRTGWHLALTAGLAVAMLAAAAWLIALALAGFQLDLKANPFRVALRRLPRLLPWLALAIAGPLLMWRLSRYGPQVAAWLASAVAVALRRPSNLDLLASIYKAALWAVGLGWFFAALPLAARAAGGAGSVGDAVRRLRRWRYWLVCAACAAAGLWLAPKLVAWVPQASGFAMEAASLAVRFGVAYLLVVGAWIAAAANAAPEYREVRGG